MSRVSLLSIDVLEKAKTDKFSSLKMGTSSTMRHERYSSRYKNRYVLLEGCKDGDGGQDDVDIFKWYACECGQF